MHMCICDIGALSARALAYIFEVNDEKHESGEDDNFGLSARKIAFDCKTKTRFVNVREASLRNTREPRSAPSQKLFQLHYYWT